MSVEKSMASASLAEVVGRILDKGTVVDTWVRVRLAGIGRSWPVERVTAHANYRLHKTTHQGQEQVCGQEHQRDAGVRGSRCPFHGQLS